MFSTNRIPFIPRRPRGRNKAKTMPLPKEEDSTELSVSSGMWKQQQKKRETPSILDEVLVECVEDDDTLVSAYDRSFASSVYDGTGDVSIPEGGTFDDDTSTRNRSRLSTLASDGQSSGFTDEYDDYYYDDDGYYFDDN